MKIPKMSDTGCNGCPALCCNGLEEGIIRPNTRQEVDNLKWELHFVNTRIFIRSKRWYKLSMGKCRYLDDNNRCTIYETRPQVCRDHSPPSCEYHASIYDVMFQNPEELQAFIDEENEAKRRKRAKQPAKAGKKNARRKS